MAWLGFLIGFPLGAVFGGVMVLLWDAWRSLSDVPAKARGSLASRVDEQGEVRLQIVRRRG